MIIKIYCKECGSKLTDELTAIPESLLCWEDGQAIMPKNNFSFFYNKMSGTDSIMVAIDQYHLKDHPDQSRFYGCCGSSGLDGLNKLCVNGHEVATEVSDCFTNHYIDFDNNKVVVKEKIDDYTYKIVFKK
jgi:hypothetical protein